MKVHDTRLTEKWVRKIILVIPSIIVSSYTNRTPFLPTYLAALNKDYIFQLPFLQLGVTCD